MSGPAHLAIGRILCPVDFSENSRHAIDHAVAMARWYGATLLALHVYTPMFMPVPGLPAPEDRVAEPELARVRARASEWLEAAGVEAVEVVVEVGQPARHILERAAHLPADLIVMGTHGSSGFEHLVLGSVTEKVLRKATCPVLTVPPRAHTTSALPFRHVLCAVDFSESSIAGVRLACSLAEGARFALTLLHVVEWPWEEPPAPDLSELPPAQASALADYRRSVEKSGTDRLQALVQEVAGGSCSTAARLAHGKAHVQILRVAAELNADLIVMGVHGRNAADLMLFGSTTHQIVRRASCPVLTLRR